VSHAALAAAVAQLGGLDSEPQPLDGGITNRNFRVRWRGLDVVLRLPGKDTELLGIDREAERAATEAAAAEGIGPRVEAFLPGPNCLVTRFLAGTPMTPEQVREPGALAQIAAALRVFHASPALPARFDAFDLVRRYGELAAARGGTVPDDHRALLAAAREIAAAIGDDPEHAPVPCHNDLLPANLLAHGPRVVIVDWEYAGMGDRYFDLANLSANNAFGANEDERLLEAYFGEPPTPRRLAGLRVMRIMSDFREGMWGVVQATLSELDFDFGAYAGTHLARVRAALEHPDHRDHLETLRGPRP
jgi:thiamine kinase-like enzyme